MHTFSQRWNNSGALSGSTTPTRVLDPLPLEIVSTGVAGNQSSALAISRTAAAAFTTTTLVDSTTTPWTASAYVGHIVRIVAGTGLGNVRLITANTNQALTVDIPFTATPDATTRFSIYQPSRAVPVITDMDLFDATGGGITIDSKALVDGVMTTRTMSIQISAAAELKTFHGVCFVGLVGGDIRLTANGAVTGNFYANGYRVNSPEMIVG